MCFVVSITRVVRHMPSVSLFCASEFSQPLFPRLRLCYPRLFSFWAGLPCRATSLLAMPGLVAFRAAYGLRTSSSGVSASFIPLYCRNPWLVRVVAGSMGTSMRSPRLVRTCVTTTSSLAPRRCRSLSSSTSSLPSILAGLLRSSSAIVLSSGWGLYASLGICSRWSSRISTSGGVVGLSRSGRRFRTLTSSGMLVDARSERSLCSSPSRLAICLRRGGALRLWPWTRSCSGTITSCSS